METKINMSNYDKEIQIEEKHTPILEWTRKPTKAEKEKGFNEPITMYQNLHTGKRAAYLPDIVEDGESYFILKRQSKDVIGTYYKATSDKKYLCCIICSISTKAVKEDEIRHWTEVRRYYFSKQKEVFFKPDYIYVHRNVTEDGYYIWLNGKAADLPVDYTKYMQISSDCPKFYNIEGNSNFVEEVGKVFTPVVTLAGNRIVELARPSSFDWFMCYNEPFKKTGPKQKKIDELVAMKLPEIDIPSKESLANIYNWYVSKDVYKFAVVNKISDGFICVRTFALVARENMPEEDYYVYESARIYINGNEIISCRPNNYGEYINMPLSLADEHWKFPILEFDGNITKDTTLEYYGSIIEDLPSEVRLLMLKLLINHPEVEQLYKGGLKNIIISSIKNSWGDSWEKINSNLRINKNGKNLYEKIGINKNQLAKINKYWDEIDQNMFNGDIIFQLKEWFQADDIRDIDDKTFDAIFSTIVKLTDNCIKQTVKKVLWTYSLDAMLNMVEPLSGIVGETVDTESRWGVYKISAIRLYTDYIDMVHQMNAKNHFRPYFENVEDIKTKHDAVTLIFNAKKDVFQKEAFIKSVKKIEKYAYSDDKYSIVTPKIPEDLAKEGLELRHCVKSYISKVSNGSTNILFLRRNEEIDKPFFTIELSNSGTIEQIHGFCNRNMSTEPDIEYFVKAWIKEKKLNSSNYNKVR